MVPQLANTEFNAFFYNRKVTEPNNSLTKYRTRKKNHRNARNELKCKVYTKLIGPQIELQFRDVVDFYSNHRIIRVKR